MLEYNAQHYIELYNTELGKSVWDYLNSMEAWYGLEHATSLGHPAVEGIGDKLFQRFGRDENLRSDRFKQMMGHMIKQIMEYYGYEKDNQGVICRFQKLFISGTRYKKKKNTIQYKDSLIEAIPDRLITNEWTTSILILENRGNSLVTTPYFTNNKHKTKMEAIDFCFRFGKDVIDGKVMNLVKL